MTYALIQDGTIAEYPVYEGDIRLRYSNVSFGINFIPPEGYVEVNDTPRPDVDYKKVITEGHPELVNSQWARVWIVSDATAEQIAEYEASLMEYNRQRRNQKLRDTDWTQLGDVNLTADCKAAFTAYRQALRDADMLNPTWPDAPAEEWA